MPQKLIQHSLGFSRESRMDSIMRSSKQIMFTTKTKNKHMSNLLEFERKKIKDDEQLVLIHANRNINNERRCLTNMIALRKIYQRHSFDKYDPILHPQKRNRYCHLDARDLMKMWFKGKTISIEKSEPDIQSQTESRPPSSIFKRMRITSGRSRKLSSISGEGNTWGNLLSETIHEEPKWDLDTLVDEDTAHSDVDNAQAAFAEVHNNSPKYSFVQNKKSSHSGINYNDMQIPRQSIGNDEMITENRIHNKDKLTITTGGSNLNSENESSQSIKEKESDTRVDQNGSQGNNIEKTNSKDSKQDVTKLVSLILPTTTEAKIESEIKEFDSEGENGLDRSGSFSRPQNNCVNSDHGKDKAIDKAISSQNRLNETKNDQTNGQMVERTVQEMRNCKVAKNIFQQNKEFSERDKNMFKPASKLVHQIKKRTETEESNQIYSKANDRKISEQGSLNKAKTVPFKKEHTSVSPLTRLREKTNLSMPSVSRERSDISTSSKSRGKTSASTSRGKNTLASNRVKSGNSSKSIGKQDDNTVTASYKDSVTTPPKTVTKANASGTISSNFKPPTTAPSVMKRPRSKEASKQNTAISMTDETRRSSSASSLRFDTTHMGNAATNNPINWKGLVHKLKGQNTDTIVDDKVVNVRSTRRLKRREKTFVLTRERTIFPGECKTTFQMRKFIDKEVSDLIFSMSPKGKRQSQIELLKERENFRLPLFMDKSKPTSAIFREFKNPPQTGRMMTAPS